VTGSRWAGTRCSFFDGAAFPLIGDNISGVIFHGYGNIYKDVGSISSATKQRDVTLLYWCSGGFGIRYRTPVGPIRVDLAYSFNRRTSTDLRRVRPFNSF